MLHVEHFDIILNSIGAIVTELCGSEKSPMLLKIIYDNIKLYAIHRTVEKKMFFSGAT